MYFCFSSLNAVFDPDAQPMSVELASAIPEASKCKVLGAGLGVFGQRQQARRATSSDQKTNVLQCPQGPELSVLVNLDLVSMLYATSMSNLPTGVTVQSASTWTLYRTPVCVPEVPWAAGEGVGGGKGTYVFTLQGFLRNGLRAPLLCSGSFLNFPETMGCWAP